MNQFFQVVFGAVIITIILLVYSFTAWPRGAGLQKSIPKLSPYEPMVIALIQEDTEQRIISAINGRK